MPLAEGWVTRTSRPVTAIGSRPSETVTRYPTIFASPVAVGGVQARVAAVAAVRSFGLVGAAGSALAAVGLSGAEASEGAPVPRSLLAATVTVKGPPPAGSPPMRSRAVRLNSAAPTDCWAT